ncbi:MAG TPA: hypothetical protein VHE55_11090 [Fimbriimonadaceae bacterium]|nr:hypothetical protein [Fimbriimonadaceae bacterium]
MSLPSIFDLIQQPTQKPKPAPDDKPSADDIFSRFGIEPSPAFAKTQASDKPGEGQKPAKKPTPAEQRVADAEYWSDPKHWEAYEKKYVDSHGNFLYDKCPTKGHGKHPEFTDCGRFMHLLYSKSDPFFPKVGTGAIDDYMNPGFFSKVVRDAMGNDYTTGKIDDKSIKPGDLLVKPPPDGGTGHVAMLGKVFKDKKGRTWYTIYDASFGDYPATKKSAGRLPTKHLVRSLREFHYYARPQGE